MENVKKLLPEGVDSVEEALEPQSFSGVSTDEKQLFMTPWQQIMRRFFSNRLAVIGMIALVVMFLFCFVLPIFYPYSETEIFYVDLETGAHLRMTETDRIGGQNAMLLSLDPPGSSHILGTNKTGQDMLARLMYGGRVSLLVAFVVIIVEVVIGITLGGIAGYYGKLPGAIIMRLVDIVSSIPFMPLMLIIASLLVSLNVTPQNKIYYTMIVIGLLYWVSVTRIVRGSILSLRESEFIQAADATGIRTRNKIFRHLIPNTLPNIIVTATLDLGSVIILESTLSFLGVGVGTPYASWGNMVSVISDNQIMQNHPNVWFAPGLCILITVMAFNFIGDGLRDATDPKSKR